MKPLALLVAFSKAYKNSPSGLTHKQSAEYVAREFLFAVLQVQNSPIFATFGVRTRSYMLIEITYLYVLLILIEFKLFYLRHLLLYFI